MQDSKQATSKDGTKEDGEKEKLQRALHDWKNSIFYMVISIAITALILAFLNAVGVM